MSKIYTFLILVVTLNVYGQDASLISTSCVDTNVTMGTFPMLNLEADEAGAGTTYQWIDAFTEEHLLHETNKMIFGKGESKDVRVILQQGNCIDTSATYLLPENMNCPTPVVSAVPANDPATEVKFGVSMMPLAGDYELYLDGSQNVADRVTTGSFLMTTSNEVVITGLSPNTAYDLYVRGLCEDGNGGVDPTFYTKVDVATTNPILFCEDITNLTLVAGSETEFGASFEWTMPTTGQPVIGYDWAVRDIGSTTNIAGSRILAQDSSKVVATQLQPNTTYEFYVRAVCGTAVGEHSNNQVVQFTTAEAINVSTEEIADQFIHVYPNPTSDIIHIETTSTTHTSVLYNAQGQYIFNAGNDKSIDMSYLPDGLYFIEVNALTQTVLMKVVKR